ncbi:MAG: bacteriohemerythrin [Neisseria sp.]|uniref:bacteriohemerythrin n=1 Tax=Neisseria sp. TaxID=192066 RepID=UPI0026DAFF85|nr:bacteriohemerythrin [Neisseria sp.]MDO4248108.1 bacteriohemerythrin [Neisseria sp.]
MTLLHWTADLELGIEEIDRQHQQLVECINDLHEAHHNHNREAVGSALDALIQYTVEHFAYEEEILRQSDYPLLTAHARVHQHFVDKVNTFKGRFNNGDDIGQELLDLMEGWLFMHIRRNDHGYAEHVKRSILDS